MSVHEGASYQTYCPDYSDDGGTALIQAIKQERFVAF